MPAAGPARPRRAGAGAGAGRIVRVGAAALLPVVIALAACSSPAPARPTHPLRSRPPLPVCAPGQLDVSVQLDGRGRDQTFWVVGFRNRGTPCAVAGFPVVVAAGEGDARLGPAAVPVRDHFSPRVRLRTGDRATASLFTRDIAADGAFAYEQQHHLRDTCHAVPAAGFAVIAPGAATSVVVRVPALRSCTGTQPWMAVTAIEG